MTQRLQGKVSFWNIIGAIFFGNFIAALSSTTVIIAMPVFMTEYDVPLTTVQWLMSGFILASAIVAPLVGYAGDKMSYKHLYIVSLVGFTLMSILCMFAWNIESLIMFRIMQGVFCGLITPTTMTIVYQVIEKEKQAMALGLWSAAGMLAPAFGPSLGGWIVQSLGLESLFAINIPIGIIAIFFAIRYIPYYRINQGVKLDYLGMFSALAGTSSLLVAFSQSNSWGWTSWKTLFMLIIGSVLIVFFVIRTLKISYPLLDLKLFLYPKFAYSLIISCAHSLSLYTAAFLVPYYLQQVKDLSPFVTGLIMIPGTLSMVIATILSGKIYNRIGPFKLIITGIILMAAANWMLGTLTASSTILFVTAWLIVRYTGIAASSMPITNVGMAVIPTHLTGQASALLNWIRQSVIALSISLFSTILTWRTVHHMESYESSNVTNTQAVIVASERSVQDVFMLGTIIIIAIIPLTFLLREKRATQNSIPVEHL